MIRIIFRNIYSVCEFGTAGTVEVSAALEKSSRLTAQSEDLNLDLLSSSPLLILVLNDTYTTVFFSSSYILWTLNVLKNMDFDSSNTSYTTGVKK